MPSRAPAADPPPPSKRLPIFVTVLSHCVWLRTHWHLQAMGKLTAAFASWRALIPPSRLVPAWFFLASQRPVQLSRSRHQSAPRPAMAPSSPSRLRSSPPSRVVPASCLPSQRPVQVTSLFSQVHDYLLCLLLHFGLAQLCLASHATKVCRPIGLQSIPHVADGVHFCSAADGCLPVPSLNVRLSMLCRMTIEWHHLSCAAKGCPPLPLRAACTPGTGSCACTDGTCRFNEASRHTDGLAQFVCQ